MPKKSYTLLSYDFLFTGDSKPLITWLAYELSSKTHPAYLLAIRLAKAKNIEEKNKLCQSVAKQELNFLVQKIRLFLSIESLKQHPAQQDDLLIKYLVSQDTGLELLRVIRLAKRRLEKKAFKKSEDLQYLHDWTNWEHYYLTRFLPKDRNKQNLTPLKAKIWTERLELELIYLGTQYLIYPPQNKEIRELLDWLQGLDSSLVSNAPLFLFQRLRELWQYMPEDGRSNSTLEDKVIESLFVAEGNLHRDYFANLYVQTLNYFIRKTQCTSQYAGYAKLISLYQWGLENEIYPMNRQFFLSISKTYLNLAELSESEKDTWLNQCTVFVNRYHKSLSRSEQGPCRKYIETHINFVKGNFEEVILPLNSDRVPDPHYSLLTFFTSLQVWYEKGDYAWVRALLKKKKKAKTEWKQLGPKARQMLEIRLDLFSALLNARKRESLDELEQAIKKPRPLEGRVWLLNKVAEKKALL